MKIIYILLFFASIGINNLILSQNNLQVERQLFHFNNTSWYMQGSHWNAEEFSVSSKDYFQLSTKLGKIDATKNVYYKINSTLPMHIDGVRTKQFLVRQDSASGIVFARSFINEEKEFLLYNFNLNLGDTIHSLLTINMPHNLIVTKINSISNNGKSYKQIVAHVEGDTERRSFKFMEGIGSAYGFIVDLNEQRDNITVLKCYSTQRTKIYTNGTCKTAPTTRQRPARPPRTVINKK